MKILCKFCGQDVGDGKECQEAKVCPACVNRLYDKEKNKHINGLKKDMRKY